MATNIGTGPQDIPLNQFLGEMAFMDGTFSQGYYTPTFSFGGGTTGMTFNMREGHYTKIGKQVIFQFRIELTAKGTSTGGMNLSLPFNCRNIFSTTGIDGNIFVGYTSGFSSGNVGDSPISGYVEGGTNTVFFTALRPTGNAATLNQTDAENNMSMSGTAIYLTD